MYNLIGASHARHVSLALVIALAAVSINADCYDETAPQTKCNKRMAKPTLLELTVP